MKVIRQVESLTAQEKQQLFGWAENVFGVEPLQLSWRPKDLHFLFDSDGKAISHVGILKHEITVNGEAITVGGVGGVVTVPAAQKQGLARQLMQHTAIFLAREWQVAAGLLFCLPEMVAYYEALRWQRVENPVLIEQPTGAIPAPLHVMELPLGREDWLDGSIELRSLPW